ncbi:MAG TPA: hypothetical protein VFQ71_09380 [Gaiellales bacterium]|nr:hypothetical protein [Gaiellales bacterium]
MKGIWLFLPLLAAGCFGGSGHAAAPSPERPPAAVITEARSFAEGLGRPRTLQVVERPDRSSWLIVVTGNLVCGACSHPAGTPTITGHAASETWTPDGGTTTVSVTEHPPALRPGVTVTDVPLLTRVSVDYPLGPLQSRAAARARCAGQPGCRVVRAQRRFWFADVHRHLACGAAPAGTYANPAGACRALRRLYRISREPQTAACGCVLILSGTPPSVVRGTVDGARARISVDSCSLCGLGTQASHAAATLM